MWPPEHIAGGLITLFGSIFGLLWAWGIKERRRQTTVLSGAIDSIIKGYETMLAGYHGLIDDMAKNISALQAKIETERIAEQKSCERQLLDLEMTLLKDLRDMQSAYESTIRELRNGDKSEVGITEIREGSGEG